MTRRNFMQNHNGRDERGQMERVVNGETGETRPLADNTGSCRPDCITRQRKGSRFTLLTAVHEEGKRNPTPVITCYRVTINWYLIVNGDGPPLSSKSISRCVNYTRLESEYIRGYYHRAPTLSCKFARVLHVVRRARALITISGRRRETRRINRRDDLKSV